MKSNGNVFVSQAPGRILPLLETINVFLCRYVFACLYSLEMIVKIVASGFVFHKHAYLRDPWNILDFVVVILG